MVELWSVVGDGDDLIFSYCYFAKYKTMVILCFPCHSFLKFYFTAL